MLAKLGKTINYLLGLSILLLAAGGFSYTLPAVDDSGDIDADAAHKAGFAFFCIVFILALIQLVMTARMR